MQLIFDVSDYHLIFSPFQIDDSLYIVNNLLSRSRIVLIFSQTITINSIFNILVSILSHLEKVNISIRYFLQRQETKRIYINLNSLSIYSIVFHLLIKF
jgi:hypothetical protein